MRGCATVEVMVTVKTQQTKATRKKKKILYFRRENESKHSSQISTPNDARLAEKGEGNARVPDVTTKHVRAAPAVVQCGYVFYSFQSFVFHLGHRSVGWLVSWGSWVT
jgi:hypothetical protein